MKKKILFLALVIVIVVIMIFISITAFSGKIREYKKNNKTYTDEDIIISLKEASLRLHENEKEIIAYVNDMPVTSMEFNSYLISNAVSRIGEEITDEEIIHEIAKYKIIENEAAKYGVSISESRYAELVSHAQKICKKEMDDETSVFKAAGISSDMIFLIQMNLELQFEYNKNFITSVLCQGLLSGTIISDNKTVNEQIIKAKEAKDGIDALASQKDSEEKMKKVSELTSEYTNSALNACNKYIDWLVETSKITIVN